MSLVPAGWLPRPCRRLSASATVWPSSISRSSSSRTSLTRIFSSPSRRRTSPMRSPRSFSTTWSSMREKIFTSMTTPSMPGGTLRRRVLHVLRLLTEDRGEQLLFRRELGLALRRDLADEDVARLHVRADAHDAALVEIDQRLFGDVRDLARDLFLTALRVADVQLELLDVDRRVHVVLHQALGEHDGVLEVVAVPRHEGDGHVGAERELALLGRGAVGEHVARPSPSGRA